MVQLNIIHLLWSYLIRESIKYEFGDPSELSLILMSVHFYTRLPHRAYIQILRKNMEYASKVGLSYK